VSAVFHPRSNDEQYQALLAAQSALRALTTDEKRVVGSAAEHVLKTVEPDSARAGVAEAIVTSLSD
jgi:hypothetical protein